MMATQAKQRRSADAPDVVPSSPISTPPPNAGGGDYSPYVWQQLGEIQKCLGRLESSVERLSGDIGKLDERLDAANSKLSGVTHKLYAAGVVLTLLLAIGGFIVNKAWDLMAKTLEDKTRPAASAVASPSVK